MIKIKILLGSFPRKTIIDSFSNNPDRISMPLRRVILVGVQYAEIFEFCQGKSDSSSNHVDTIEAIGVHLSREAIRRKNE